MAKLKYPCQHREAIFLYPCKPPLTQPPSLPTIFNMYHSDFSHCSCRHGHLHREVSSCLPNVVDTFRSSAASHPGDSFPPDTVTLPAPLTIYHLCPSWSSVLTSPSLSLSTAHIFSDLILSLAVEYLDVDVPSSLCLNPLLPSAVPCVFHCDVCHHHSLRCLS